jgi:orotidine-5'-phosphate decarboxylase
MTVYDTSVSTAATDIRSRLCLALDVDDDVEALQLARSLSPWFGVMKVGLELFTASGPTIVTKLAQEGFGVFLDLKLHDIPNTVNRAARVCGSLGVSYLTMHAHGGSDMLSAGVEGLRDGAIAAGMPAPIALGVTILTSDDSAPHHILGKRLMTSMEGGCGGVVCAASDLKEVGLLAPRMVRVVPGIRPTSAEVNDQARPATPTDAISAGADLLVIGRPVVQAKDREAAAAAISDEIVAALA